MAPSSSPRDLEPVVAHGARMSWAGILRTGDEFCRPRRARIATLASAAGPPLERYFGAWSTKYRRFTSNLSTPAVVARPVEADAGPSEGIQCILHWIDRADVLRLGPGGVCEGDGWPVELWRTFIANLDRLPEGTVGERLQEFLESDLASDVPVVMAWRSLILGPREFTPMESSMEQGWVPVPIPLRSASGPRACLLSWSASRMRYDSLEEALHSPEADLRHPEIHHQAAYYLECTLAKLHGVRFGPRDFIEDERFAKRPTVAGLSGTLSELELRRIADPNFGPLSRFG